jgi:hypothetical protein
MTRWFVAASLAVLASLEFAPPNIDAVQAAFGEGICVQLTQPQAFNAIAHRPVREQVAFQGPANAGLAAAPQQGLDLRPARAVADFPSNAPTSYSLVAGHGWFLQG